MSFSNRFLTKARIKHRLITKYTSTVSLDIVKAENQLYLFICADY